MHKYTALPDLPVLQDREGRLGFMAILVREAALVLRAPKDCRDLKGLLV